MTPFKVHKVKFNPNKIKQLFSYEFTQYLQPQPEDEVIIAPVIPDPVKGKAPPKLKEEPQDLQIPFLKMSKNILFDRIEAVDSESDIGEPKFL